MVGYLTGCLDTARSQRVTVWRIAPPAILTAIGRGVLFHRQTWQFFAKLRPFRRADLREYPAHIHVNVAPGFRGGAIGRELLALFFAHAGKVGVHANVRTDNARGRNFFEQTGFVVLNAGASTVVYGKKL